MSRTKLALSLAALALFVDSTTALAQPASPPKGYLAYRATTAVTVDGKVDEAAWATAPWTDAFVDIEGDKKPRPRFETRAKMLWDDRYFYVAAELKEPHVSATITKHDAVIFHDNDFEIFIDPDGDNHDYYELEVNALNAEWDLLLKKAYRDGGPALNEWEVPGLKTATHVAGTLNDASDVDRGWSVEFAVPWAALGEFAGRAVPPRDGDSWRVNFSRVEWEYAVEGKGYAKVPSRPEANWVWSPQGVIDMHQPEFWGYVQFTAAPAGLGAYRVEPGVEARALLMKVYHAERAYQARNGAWAGSLEKLGEGFLQGTAGASAVVLRLTPEGYEATATAGGGAWTVRQDSRLRKVK